MKQTQPLLTLLLLALSINGVFSQQVLDKAYLNCQYEYTRKSDTLIGKTKDDQLILQVGEKVSKCYSHYSNQVDSINAQPIGR